jgi:glycosyltransferase involved in cell wall biosynthesis
LISIITAVRNGARTVEQAIQSVLNQTYDNIEYIIIDGASTDGTLEIIRKYDASIAYWRSEPDQGLYDAMNKGIAASTGELINLLNADDYLELTAVERVVQAYRGLGKPGIVYGHAYAVDDQYGVKARMLSSPSYWLGMSINHQTMFVHRDVYRTIGLYNGDVFRFAADYDFLLRCISHPTEFHMIPECLVSFRNSGISSSGRQYRKEASLINKRHFGAFSLRRLAFLVFNFLWMPLKLNLRTALYRTLGVASSRWLIAAYKKAIRGG